MTLVTSGTARTVYSINDLKAAVTGRVILPDESAYEASRKAWNIAVDQHPALILAAATAQDIAAGVRYAKANDLNVAIQSTGHGVILPANHALLILTAGLNEVKVNAAAQIAYVGAGVKWGAVLEKAQDVGLAPLLGSSPTVGAVGYTLGGGMGWLARKYGMAVDSVLSFEVVTADGEVIHASAGENSDLYWGLRGGGKGLAIVTGMTIRLYPVTTVYGGTLTYPIEKAKDALKFFREWITVLPKDWTVSICIMHYPPMPELPPSLRGQSFVMIHGCYTGNDVIGQAAVQAWLDWAEPTTNTFQPMSFRDVAQISNDPQNPTPGVSSGAWLTDLSDETIETLLQFVGQPSLLLKAEIRYAGGAIAELQPDSTAYSHRNAELLLGTVGVVFAPEVKEKIVAYTAAMKQALAAHIDGTYMNFLEGKEAQERTRDGFSEAAYQRLIDLKFKYDPDNLFCFAFNFGAKA